MKKNISINISGMIFYIEEDCYEQLKEYLGSVYKYFASYEDSKEIISDIENRIAEIFCDMLSKNKQVITQADVEELIRTMGSVDDFQAEEEILMSDKPLENPVLDIPTEDDFKGGSTSVQLIQHSKKQKVEEREEEEVYDKEKLIYASSLAKEYQQKTHFETETEVNYKRLYRDSQRKIVGGVAAGLAHYLNVDPIWVRLFFVVLSSGLFFIEAMPLIALAAYIAMWIVVPNNEHLLENPRIKKLYRDPQHGVLGGVCSGLAAYWGINDLIVRVFFLIGFGFFGTGILIYILLWSILPQANTLTERMEMEGQAINLVNILASIKDKDKDKPEEDSRIEKVVYFPFKLAGLGLEQMKFILKPLVGFTAEAIRVGGGLFLLLISLAMTAGFGYVILALAGVDVDTRYIRLGDIPLELLKKNFGGNGLMIASVATTTLLPILFFGLFGVMMLRKRIIWNNRFGWSLAGLWLISLVGTGVSVANVAKNFREDVIIEDTQKFTYTDKTLLFALNENDDKNRQEVTLTIRGYEGDEIKVMKEFKAYGLDPQKATQNAAMIDYKITQRDSVIRFDQYFSFRKDARYYGQKLQLTLYVPFEKEFAMSQQLEEILRNTIYKNGYDKNDIGNNRWKFTTEKLYCITCDQEKDLSEGKIAAGGKELNLDEFSSIELSGQFKVQVKKGDKHRLVLGENTQSENLLIENMGGHLEISPKNKKRQKQRYYILEIYTPELERISLNGASKGQVSGFQFKDFDVELAGASVLQVSGKAKRLKLDLAGASVLKAYELTTDEALVDVSGACKAEINVLNDLNAEVSGASTVHYRGNPKNMISDVSGMSSVVKQ